MITAFLGYVNMFCPEASQKALSLTSNAQLQNAVTHMILSKPGCCIQLQIPGCALHADLVKHGVTLPFTLQHTTETHLAFDGGDADGGVLCQVLHLHSQLKKALTQLLCLILRASLT